METLRYSLLHAEKVAVISGGLTYSFSNLLSSATSWAKDLKITATPEDYSTQALTAANHTNGKEVAKNGTFNSSLPDDTEKVIDGPRIAIFGQPSANFVSGVWGIWFSGGIVVPLAVSHPQAELIHVIKDSVSEL